MIEAKKFNASIAVMLVHSFSDTNEWFEDYQLFLELYGKRDVTIDKLYFLKTVSGIELYSGWVKGKISEKLICLSWTSMISTHFVLKRYNVYIEEPSSTQCFFT